MIPQQATLQEMREEMERIDAEMVPLLARRGELTRTIGTYKRARYDGTPLAVENYDAMQQHAMAIVGGSHDAVWVATHVPPARVGVRGARAERAQRRLRTLPPRLIRLGLGAVALRLYRLSV